MELFLVGINILILMVVWKFMLRKTILDHHRDQLFDLRDKLRADYLRNGWDLNSAMYRRLRSLINGYLRFTEDYTLIPYFWLNAHVVQSDELQVELKRRVDREFHTNSVEEAKYIKEFRLNALQIMMGYMTLSSGPLLILSTLLVPIVLVWSIAQIATRGVRVASSVFCRKTVDFKETLMALSRLVVGIVAQKFLHAEFVEEYSYQRGLR